MSTSDFYDCYSCCQNNGAWNQADNYCYTNYYGYYPSCAPSECPYDTSDIIFLTVSSTVVPIIFIVSLFCVWFKYSYLSHHCQNCDHNHSTPSFCDTTFYTTVTRPFTEKRLIPKTVNQPIVIDDRNSKFLIMEITPDAYEDVIVDKQVSEGKQCKCDKFIRNYCYCSSLNNICTVILILFIILFELQIIFMIVLALTVDDYSYNRFFWW